MNLIKAYPILCLLIFGMVLPVFPQNTTENDNKDLFRRIETDFTEGKLTLEQKLRYKFNAGQDSSELPDQYRSAESDTPLKCGTPATTDLHRNRHQLSDATFKEIAPKQAVTLHQATESYISASGNFEIQYETTGSHAVPGDDENGNGVPDYVEEAADAADSSYNHMVQTLGYTDPLVADSPYRIELINLISVYGLTYTTNESTVIQIENDFAEEFPPNDHPRGDQIGALKATVAHELKHAIQYAASEWDGESGNWLEMDATLMEEVVYDEVNDYYNYINSQESIFNGPGKSFYPGSYYHVSWAIYFEEKYGPEFWPQVWEIIETEPEITLVEALTRQLGGEEAFHEAYTESQLWHYASGGNAREGFGFEEALNYPDPAVEKDEHFYTESFSIPRSQTPPKVPALEHFSAQYVEVPVPEEVTGKISLEIPSEEEYQGTGLIVFNETEEILSSIYVSGENNFSTSEARFEDTEKIGLIFTNASTSESTGQTIAAIGPDFDNPQAVTLNHNYPNPFSETTRIRFTVDEPTQVSLKVFDVAGRLVQTLIDEELEPGMYEPTFDGSELASGVYLYQLSTGNQMFVEKMTLIK